MTAGEEYFERKFVKKKEKISENIFLTMWKKGTEGQEEKLLSAAIFQEEKFHHTVIKNDDIAQKIFFQLF